MKKINYKYLMAILMLLMTSVIISCNDDDDDEKDIVNPYVVSYNPVSGVTGVDVSSNIVLTFDDIVYKGDGNITITTDIEQGNQVIDVNSDDVTISNVGRVMTINPDDFLSGREYTVVIDAGIVVDEAGNAYFGMPDGEEWTFTTGGNTDDFDAPEIASLYPENGASDGNVINMQLTFNEDIKVASGNFIVYSSAGVAVETIDAEGDQVTVDGTDISISFAEPLDFGTAYYVNFDAGVVKDVAGNNFSGFTDKTSWSFTTTTGSDSDLIVHFPFDEDLTDDSGNKFNAVVKYNESEDNPNPTIEFVEDETRGKVVKFNAGAYVQLPKHDLLRPADTQDFSINLWVKTPGIGSDPAIFTNSDWGSGGNPGILICSHKGDSYDPDVAQDDVHGMIVNLAGYPKDDYRMDWHADETSPSAAPAIANNEWHMITLVLDQNAQKLHVYIDGTEYGNDTDAASYDLSTISGPLYDKDNDYPWTIWEDGTGKYNANSSTRSTITGCVDELSLYNKALSVDEVKALFAK